MQGEEIKIKTRTKKDRPLGVSADLSQEVLDEAKEMIDEYFANNELVVTDKHLYDNIDKIPKNSYVTCIQINFSNEAVQEEALAKLSQIKNLVNLKLLFFDSNITKIPKAIFEITSLQELRIRNINADELPSAIGNLKNGLMKNTGV